MRIDLEKMKNVEFFMSYPVTNFLMTRVGMKNMATETEGDDDEEEE